MQDNFYSGLKTQDIQIINHTIQYLNQDFFLNKCPQPAHPDFLKPTIEHPNIRNSARCLLINQDQEETGYLLKNPKPIGNIHEQRYDGINITYFFSAQPDKVLHTNYMPDKIEEDYILKWFSLPEALQIFQTVCNEQRLHNFPSYKGAFISYRFLELLQYFIKNT